MQGIGDASQLQRKPPGTALFVPLSFKKFGRHIPARPNCRTGTAQSNPYLKFALFAQEGCHLAPRSMAAFFMPGLD